MVSEDFDYSRIFYGGSALFAVLSVLYFGFEYIQNLSPFTIASVMFAVFMSSLLAGVSRETRGVKLVSYLVSAGSYIGFLIYINNRFLTTSNGTLASLVVSAGLFSAIGFVLTNKQEHIPSRDQLIKIFAGIAILLTVLIVYDVTATGYDLSMSLEDEVEITEEETKFGEVETAKYGYLPVDIDMERLEVCIATGDDTHGVGTTRSIGGFTTGFAPETRTDDLEFRIGSHRLEQIDGIEVGETFQVEVIEDCSRSELEEGSLGIVIPEDVDLIENEE